MKLEQTSFINGNKKPFVPENPPLFILTRVPVTPRYLSLSITDSVTSQARGAPAPWKAQTLVQKLALTLQRSVLVKEVYPRRLLLQMALGVMRGCLGLGDRAWGILFT
jgi:hypothetical protein